MISFDNKSIHGTIPRPNHKVRAFCFHTLDGTTFVRNCYIEELIMWDYKNYKRKRIRKHLEPDKPENVPAEIADAPDTENAEVVTCPIKEHIEMKVDS